MSEFKLVRMIPAGNGSKRVTIPKAMLEEVFGERDYVAVSQEKGGILLKPVEIRPIETKTKSK